jgi:parvulin-like peptidyl-prolyl isomerase
MRRQLTLLLVPIALLAAAAGCGGSSGGSSGPVPSDAVAVVGDQTITKAQFDDLIDQYKSGAEARKQSFPKQGTAQYEQLKQQTTNYLVQRSEFEQKADDMDISVTDKQVDDRLDQKIKQLFDGSDKKYQAQLKKQGLTDEQVKDSIRFELLSEKLYKDVTKGTTVSDEDVRKYYDKNKAKYETGESRDLLHILVACGSSSPATSGSKSRTCGDAKALADKLYTQLKGGANFGALAKKYSDDPVSAAQGGKYTAVRGQSVLEPDAFTLDKGAISKPIKSQYGYHIIQPVSSIHPKHSTPFSQAKETIRQTLLQQKKTEVSSDWVKDLQKEFDVRYQVGYAPQNTQQ